MQSFGNSHNVLLGSPHQDVLVTAHYDTARRNMINAKMYYDAAVFHTLARLPLFTLNAFCAFSANPNNRNDNTSGVLAVAEILRAAGGGGILFDNEEGGRAGSLLLMKKRPEFRKKLYINIDSIGSGDCFAVIYQKAEKAYAEALAKCFSAEVSCDRENEARYSSDGDFLQRAITIAAFKKDSFGKRYINDIHTPKDTCLRFENIQIVAQAVSAFLKQF